MEANEQAVVEEMLTAEVPEQAESAAVLADLAEEHEAQAETEETAEQAVPEGAPSPEEVEEAKQPQDDFLKAYLLGTAVCSECGELLRGASATVERDRSGVCYEHPWHPSRWTNERCRWAGKKLEPATIYLQPTGGEKS